MAGIVQSEVRHPRAGASAPCVSVILPVFNEASTAAVALGGVLEEGTSKEVIIVDDGSDDGSGAVLEGYIGSLGPLNDTTARIVLLRHRANRGKGAAIRTALATARGRFVIMQDADLEVRPSCYAALLEPLIGGTAEFVLGCRRRHFPRGLSLHVVGVAALGVIVRALYGYPVRDAACCYKVLSLENLRRMDLQADRFEFCPEVIAKASRLGLALRQVDVDYFPRGADEGKKLRLVKDGIEAILTLWRYRRWQPAPDGGLQPGLSNGLSSGAGPGRSRRRASSALPDSLPAFHVKAGSLFPRHGSTTVDELIESEGEVGVKDAAGWAEFCAWSALVMTPILWLLQGPSVSMDQFVVRTALVTISALAAVGLRIRALFFARRAEAPSSADAG